jgi:hypothetical protein
MAAIKEARHGDTSTHRSNQGGKEINHGSVRRKRSQPEQASSSKPSFVTVITKFTTVSRVMDKDSIACLESETSLR